MNNFNQKTNDNIRNNKHTKLLISSIQQKRQLHD